MSETRTAIEVHDLTVAYRHRPVLWGIDFKIPEGVRAAIVGPNGAGKSTLLKAVMGLLPLASGSVRVFGSDRRENQALIAYVPQREEVDWDFPISVSEVVMMGRYGRLPFYQRPRGVDYAAVEKALDNVGISALATRQISELSGGQQQRVFLARALAQEASIYLMDEPFAGIDAATEKAIIALLAELSKAGKTIVAVHHDLNTVPEYFDYSVLINLRLVAAGKVEDVFTAENLSETYGTRLGLLTEVAERLRQRRWSGRSE